MMGVPWESILKFGTPGLVFATVIVFLAALARILRDHRHERDAEREDRATERDSHREAMADLYRALSALTQGLADNTAKIALTAEKCATVRETFARTGGPGRES